MGANKVWSCVGIRVAREGHYGILHGGADIRYAGWRALLWSTLRENDVAAGRDVERQLSIFQ